MVCKTAATEFHYAIIISFLYLRAAFTLLISPILTIIAVVNFLHLMHQIEIALVTIMIVMIAITVFFDLCLILLIFLHINMLRM